MNLEWLGAKWRQRGWVTRVTGWLLSGRPSSALAEIGLANLITGLFTVDTRDCKTKLPDVADSRNKEKTWGQFRKLWRHKQGRWIANGMQWLTQEGKGLLVEKDSPDVSRRVLLWDMLVQQNHKRYEWVWIHSRVTTCKFHLYGRIKSISMSESLLYHSSSTGCLQANCVNGLGLAEVHGAKGGGGAGYMLICVTSLTKVWVRMLTCSWSWMT